MTKEELSTLRQQIGKLGGAAFTRKRQAIDDASRGDYGLPARFWDKVDRKAPDECWEWTGSKNQRGYGLYWANGRIQSANRTMLIAVFGQQPKHIFACHTCDNPACVNPAHLWPGTCSDNLKDCAAKGRLNHKKIPLPTHCKYGHELTSDNVYRLLSGRVRCRTCSKRAVLAHWQKRHGEDPKTSPETTHE